VAHHASPGVPNEPADVPSSRPVLH
jgi:hypothetical protein